tara:strand:- start:88 stop:450 length:363 start_codon:yes stop_codon:yes gene_type:complete
MKFMENSKVYYLVKLVRDFRSFAILHPYLTGAVAPPLYYSAFFSAAIFGSVIFHDMLLFYIPIIAFVVVPLYNLYVIAIMPSQIKRIKLFIFFLLQIAFILFLFFIIFTLSFGQIATGFD